MRSLCPAVDGQWLEKKWEDPFETLQKCRIIADHVIVIAIVTYTKP